MKVEIRYIRFEYRHSSDTPRVVAFAQLHKASPVVDNDLNATLILADTMLAQVIMYAVDHKLEIVNAQDVLKLLVIDTGFAS